MNTLSRGAAAVEIGFAKPETEVPTGVFTVCSFGWCQRRESVEARIAKNGAETVQIVDEYGREMTGESFLSMLRANVPPKLESEAHIGTWFS